MALVAALAAAVAGCGGDEPAAPGSAEETARAWVRAVDERDWARVCELTMPMPEDCPRVMARSFGDLKEPRLGHVITHGRSPRFEVTTAEGRGETPPEQEGWTAYAPIEIQLERTGDGYVAHPEVAVIR